MQQRLHIRRHKNDFIIRPNARFCCNASDQQVNLGHTRHRRAMRGDVTQDIRKGAGLKCLAFSTHWFSQDWQGRIQARVKKRLWYYLSDNHLVSPPFT